MSRKRYAQKTTDVTVCFEAGGGFEVGKCPVDKKFFMHIFVDKRSVAKNKLSENPMQNSAFQEPCAHTDSGIDWYITCRPGSPIPYLPVFFANTLILFISADNCCLSLNRTLVMCVVFTGLKPQN